MGKNIPPVTKRTDECQHLFVPYGNTRGICIKCNAERPK